MLALQINIFKDIKFSLISFFTLVLFSFPEFGNSQGFPVSVFNAPDHGLVSCLSFSPDGKLVTATDQGKVFIWNTQEKMVSNKFATKESDMLLKVAINKEGTLIAAAGKNKVVYIWDLRTGVIKYHFKGHTETITSLSFSPDGNWIASGSTDKTVKFWSLQTGIMGHEIVLHPKEISGIQFSNHGHYIATTCYDGVIRIFNTESYNLEKQFAPDAGRMRCVSFSKDDRFIAAGADDRTIKLYEFATGSLKRILKGHKGNVYSLDFSNDGKYLASGSLSNDLIIWNLENTEPAYTYNKFYKLVDINFSQDGTHLGAADFNEQVKVFNVSDLKISPTAQFEKLSKAGSGSLVQQAPKIVIVDPITTSKEMLISKEKTVLIRGNVKAESGIFLLLVGGMETVVNEDGTFEKDVKLAYNENEITVKLIDKDKRTEQQIVYVNKPFDPNAPQVSGVRKGKDYALLIATNEYEAMNHLVNPVNDLNTVALELTEKYGFTIEKLINPTLSQTYSAIKKFGSRQYADEDQLFVFIAGHGEYDPVFKEGYLVASDTKKDDDARVTYLSHSNMRTMLNNIPCKHIFLTLDACFGGTFDQGISSRGGADQYNGIDKDEFIKRKLKYKTRLYLTSGGKEYVPDGRPGQHSPFARKFLEALRSNGGEDGILSYQELVGYVEKVTPEPRKGEFGDNQPGSDFLFIRK